MENVIGKVLKSYELEKLIGTGGFGAVYRARQAVVAREVAIKVIWPAFANHPNFIRRFEAEAQLVAGLEHPYIVPLYDYWRDPDGAYIVMRYLRGGALRDKMFDHPWDVKEVNHLLENVASALALAHRYGIVHRDIKPENILLDEDGNAYLADFGIAQIMSNASSEDEFSGMGSPAYASPEQLNGGDVTFQSDIYSLGIIAWELLVGRHPFPDLAEFSMTQLIQYRQQMPLPPLQAFRMDLPPAVNEVIQKATALNPKKRYVDALTFSYELRESLNGMLKGVPKAPYVPSSALILNPYKGLRAFQESDSALFFGREMLIKRLLNRLRESELSRFLAVVGPSGSGKSSVVRAGLIPALRQGQLQGSSEWYYADFVPGERPFQELANVLNSLATTPSLNLDQRLLADETALYQLLEEVLPTPEAELFLLIDQFEEIFTLVNDEKETNQFIALLYYAVTHPKSRLRLVITIRADFYDRPLLQPRISDLMRERTEVVVPMSAQELESVIVEPARRVGVTIDNRLVGSIVAEVKEQPSALPLLQYALSELFEHREGTLIPLEAYEELGGVRGALARRADDIYQKLDNDHKTVMRQLFLRLVTLGEGTEDTRRRTLLSEVTSITESRNAQDERAIMQSVIETLGKARLLSFDRDPITRSPTVEVAHEAIIREWGNLRQWLEDSRQDVRLQRALSNLAGEWELSQRDSSFLLRQGRLEQYERWLQTTTLAMSKQERAFLEASLSEKARQTQEEQARLQREKELEQRSIRTLRVLVGVLLIAVVGALGLTTFALNESQRAEQNAVVAREQAQFSQSIALEAGARNALSEDNGDLAIVLALLANERVPNPPVTSQATLATVALARGTQKVLSGHEAGVLGVAISPDGTRIASASADALIKLWDAQTGTLLYRLNGHGGDVESVAFSADGQYLVSSGADFVAIVWDVEEGLERLRLIGHTAPIRRALFTPDGRMIVTASSDNLINVWNAQTGALIRTLSGHNASVLALAINPSGETLLSGARDGKLFYWRIATGERLGEWVGHSTALTDIAFSKDGKSAVSASGDGTLLLWDVSTGTQRLRFVGAVTEIRAVAFTPDGTSILTGAIDGVVQVWSTTNGLEIDRLIGHRDAILSLAIRLDGKSAVTGSQDQTIRLWNIGNPGELNTLSAHQQRVSELVVGQRTGNLYSASPDGVLRVFSPDLKPLRDFQLTETPILAFAVSPNETRALIGSREGKLFEIELGTGATTLNTFDSVHQGNILGASYSSDGKRAVTTSQRGEVFLWNMETKERLATFESGGKAVYNALILPNGNILSSASDDTLRLWSPSGEEIRRFTGHTGTIYAISVTSDGTRFASAGRDGFVIVWDSINGAEKARLSVGVDTVWSIAFSPDNARLLVGTSSGLLSVWHVAEAEILQRFSAPSAIFSVVFGQTERVYSGQDDGIITVWRSLGEGEAVLWARQNRYVRELDCFEREQFRVEPYCTAELAN